MTGSRPPLLDDSTRPSAPPPPAGHVYSRQGRAVGQHLAQVHAYCAIVAGHHGLEDQAVFPHLRRADPGLTPVIDRLEAEHVVIHHVMQDVDRALVNLVKGQGDLSDVDEAVDALTQTLLSHLSYEERQITEPLSRFGFFAGQL